RAVDRRVDLSDPDEEGQATDLVGPLGRAPDLVWQPDDVRRVWTDEALAPIVLEGAAELDPLPRSQAHSFEAQRPAIAARGLAEAENELSSMVRQGRRVVVAFPRLGEALRTERLLRKIEAEVVETD